MEEYRKLTELELVDMEEYALLWSVHEFDSDKILCMIKEIRELREIYKRYKELDFRMRGLEK